MERSTAFKETLDHIKSNRNNKIEGSYNSIPFGLPLLDKHIPGLMKGTYIITTASSGVGKSMLARFLGIIQPYKFIKEHPELGLKLKIFYFALEESREEFMLQLICSRLKEAYGLTITTLQLRSLGDYTLSEDLLNKVEECEEYFRELEECLEVNDTISNGFGIFNEVRKYSYENGTHYHRLLKDKTSIISSSDYDKLKESDKNLYCYSHYIANDPKEFVVVITDPINELTPEKGASLYESMGKFSADYCRKIMSKHYRYVVINVQQQNSLKERVEYSFSGQSIEAKLEPSLDSLANNSETQRHAQIVLGLFAPARYEIMEHLGYDITKLDNFYRSLKILKNRFGTPGLKLPMYFNGATNTFVQLSQPNSEEMRAIYNALDTGRRS